jgi:hypothetical protein
MDAAIATIFAVLSSGLLLAVDIGVPEGEALINVVALDGGVEATNVR